jgi:hypothetical protein
MGTAKPRKPVSRPFGLVTQPLELPARPADDIDIDPLEGRAQLRPIEVAVVVDPAFDIRVVRLGHPRDTRPERSLAGPKSCSAASSVPRGDMLSLFGRTERPSRAYGNLDWCAYLEEAAPMLDRNRREFITVLGCALQSPAAQRRCRSLRRDRPLKIQRKNSGSGNKCLRAIGTTTRSLRNWVRSAKNLI